MSDFLKPNSTINNIEDQQLLFKLRSKMLKINNILVDSQESKCICNQNLTSLHLYECNQINNSKIEVQYGAIYGDKLYEQLYVIRRMKININVIEPN